MSITHVGGVVLGALALLASAGCQTTTGSQERPKGAQAPVTGNYLERVAGAVERVSGTVAAEPTSQLPFSEPTKSGAVENAAAFKAGLGQYLQNIASVAEHWGAMGPSGVLRLDADSEKVLKALKARAVDLAHLAEATELQHKTLRQSGALSGGKVDRDRVERFLNATRELTEVVNALDEFLFAHHIKVFVPYAKITEPSAGVFHFLRAYRLNPERVGAHSGFYAGAWKKWLESRLKAGFPQQAMEIYWFALTAAEQYPPDSLQELFHIVHTCLDQRPSREAFAHMEQTLTKIKERFSKRERTPATWLPMLERVTAAFLLARAPTMENPLDGVQLAVRAREIDPRLRKRVNSYLLRAAALVGRQEIKAGRYAKAIEAFKSVATRGAPQYVSTRTQRFREETLEYGLRTTAHMVNERRFDSAKSILDQLVTLATDDADARRVKDARLAYYLRRVDDLAAKDHQQAVDACEEALGEFPDEEQLVERIDRVLYDELLIQLGPPGTIDERLGAERVLSLLRETVGRMRGNDGAAACQRLLAKIEQDWREKLYRSEECKDTYRLETELGVLTGTERPAAETRAAEVIYQRLAAAAARENWPVLESCLDFVIHQVPNLARPADIAPAYLRFLRKLAASPDEAVFVRHLEAFVKTCPRECAGARGMITARIRTGGKNTRLYQELLDSLPANVVEAPAEGDPVDSRSPTAPPRETRVPEAVQTETDTPKAAAIVGRPPLSGVGMGSAAASVIFFVALVWRTRKRGWLRFGWYAAAVFWVALSAGFVLGSKTTTETVRSGVDEALGRSSELVITKR